MYKWHINSAIGRGRPLPNDFSRVSDGIAASLRQFSVSISRAEEDAPRPTRAQRGQEAAKEILAVPSRGIDARSLAAKPPQGFTIRRVDERPNRQNGPAPRGRGNFSGDWGGRGSFTPRARGGTGVRGRGRGRARGGKKARGPRPKREDEDEEEDPWTEEELAWLAGNDGGWPTPYVPTTSLEQLVGKGPTVISSPRGAVETAVYNMQVATDNINGPHRHADEHLTRLADGHGTLFENAEARAVTQKYLNQKRERQAKFLGLEHQPVELPMLPQTQREQLAKAYIAGHYTGPKPAEKGDVLGQVDAYMRRNETYLPEDMRKLQAKLASLLPAAAAARSGAPQPVRKPL